MQTEIIDGAKKRLVNYAVKRGYRLEGIEASLRADAFAEARALCRGNGGVHAEVMKAITPTRQEVEAEHHARRQAAKARLAEKGLAGEEE
jgi:hypothetical protein